MTSLISRSKLMILVDTREQQPFAFPEHLAEVKRETLKAGDYSLDGDTQLAVERKSLDDFVGTISSGWERFLRELLRMSNHVAKVVIIEGNLTEIIDHQYNHPQVKPPFVLKRIAELTLQGVNILFADNSISAAGMCYAILKERKKEIDND